MKKQNIQYAPIIITVYTRLENLKKLISSLQKCPEASMSDLFIFSDAASKKEDEILVQEVRNYISTITGFKSIKTTLPEINSRISKIKHVYNIQEELQNVYGKYIFLEDDNIVSKHFLRFMNEALEFYKDDNRISAISGYTLPMKIPFWYKKSIYLGKRFSPWGYAMRKEWFFQFDRTPYDRYSIATKKQNINKFKAVGKDILDILYADSTGKISAGDVKICFDQIMKNQYTVFPTKTLVKNIGFDGSGEHCGATNRFDVDLIETDTYNIKLIKNIQENKIISRRFRDFQNNTNLIKKLKHFFYQIFIKFPKFILKKLGLFDFVKAKLKH